MSEQFPAPGQTWLSRDGRVAQVFENVSPGKYPGALLVLRAEYSDGSVQELLADGLWVNGCAGSRHDLVRRSPWDAVRDDLLNGEHYPRWLADHIWADAFTSIGAKCHRRNAEVLSEALEFVSWAESRGLTPETLVEMRGKVAA